MKNEKQDRRKLCNDATVSIFLWFSKELKARNGDGKKKVVCVMDGERALWKMLTRYITGIVCIIDIYHILERIWDAAHCFLPEGSQEAGGLCD